MLSKKWLVGLSMVGCLLNMVSAVKADVYIGVIVSATGPTASLGIPEKNTVALMPTLIDGQKIHYIVLDDGTDTTAAVQNAKKLVEQDHVDAIIGTTATPNSLAILDITGRASTMTIAMSPMRDHHYWAFQVPPSNILMGDAIIQHMKSKGIKTIGFIGFADPYGEGWYQDFIGLADKAGFKIIDKESYNRNDSSVTGQALKLIAAKPDAILIAGAGTPAALPEKTLRSMGYQGIFYQTHGALNGDFLRVCGADCEGTYLPSGTLMVAEQLPDSHPLKKGNLAYKKLYEDRYGRGTVSVFGSHAWDAMLLIKTALPIALKQAKPGTEAFRKALRDAVEQTKNLVAVQGFYTMSPSDHNGLDHRARVMIEIKDGAWRLVK